MPYIAWLETWDVGMRERHSDRQARVVWDVFPRMDGNSFINYHLLLLHSTRKRGQLGPLSGSLHWSNLRLESSRGKLEGAPLPEEKGLVEFSQRSWTDAFKTRRNQETQTENLKTGHRAGGCFSSLMPCFPLIHWITPQGLIYSLLTKQLSGL